MSCPTACSDAILWAICSCLTASCSTLCRMTVRSCAMVLSCCTDSKGTATAAGTGFWLIAAAGLELFFLAAVSPSGGDLFINQSSDNGQVLIILIASSLRDCQAVDNRSSDGAQVLTISIASSP